ncbi:MAG: diacylglycerol/lipid kinase family protein [Propioniciclava sp.]
MPAAGIRSADERAPAWAILNPKARDYVRARQALVRACQADGLGIPRILTTSTAEPGGGQAKEALAAGAQVVIVGGGDGTVRQVAGVLAGSGVELGILPLGTANLFAHNLGLRTRLLRIALRRALTPGATPVDIAWASWRPVIDTQLAPSTRECAFLVMAGVGHDAATVVATQETAKARFGWLAYLASGASRLRARPLAMRVSTDMRPARRIRTWTLIVANCGEIPAGIQVVAAASPFDGQLDTLEVPLSSPRQWAAVAATGLWPRLGNTVALRYGQAQTVWAVPDHPTPLHLDGDPVGDVADLRVRIQPGALLVRRGHSQTTPFNRFEILNRGRR